MVDNDEWSEDVSPSLSPPPVRITRIAVLIYFFCVIVHKMMEIMECNFTNLARIFTKLIHETF